VQDSKKRENPQARKNALASITPSRGHFQPGRKRCLASEGCSKREIKRWGAPKKGVRNSSPFRSSLAAMKKSEKCLKKRGKAPAQRHLTYPRARQQEHSSLMRAPWSQKRAAQKKKQRKPEKVRRKKGTRPLLYCSSFKRTLDSIPRKGGENPLGKCKTDRHRAFGKTEKKAATKNSIAVGRSSNATTLQPRQKNILRKN